VHINRRPACLQPVLQVQTEVRAGVVAEIIFDFFLLVAELKEAVLDQLARLQVRLVQVEIDALLVQLFLRVVEQLLQLRVRFQINDERQDAFGQLVNRVVVPVELQFDAVLRDGQAPPHLRQFRHVRNFLRGLLQTLLPHLFENLALDAVPVIELLKFV